MEIADMTTDQLLERLGVEAPTDILALKLGVWPPLVSAPAEARASSDELNANPKYFVQSCLFDTPISRAQFVELQRRVSDQARARMVPAACGKEWCGTIADSVGADGRSHENSRVPAGTEVFSPVGESMRSFCSEACAKKWTTSRARL